MQGKQVSEGKLDLPSVVTVFDPLHPLGIRGDGGKMRPKVLVVGIDGNLYGAADYGGEKTYGALYAITGSSRVSWISIGANISQVVDVVFRLKPRYATPWQVSALVIVGLIVVSISILERRVRGVEVVT